MAESNLHLIPLVPTPAEWLAAVHADFPRFLSDHASNEKKASGMALSVAAHYPDRPSLLGAMADLAVEELTHYREVIRVMARLGLVPHADEKDPYVHALNREIRRGPDLYLLDRLLVGAVVERRGAERFSLIADSLTESNAQYSELAKFYQALAESEARHWELFVELAQQECAELDVETRLAELSQREGDIMLGLPIRAALH